MPGRRLLGVLLATTLAATAAAGPESAEPKRIELSVFPDAITLDGAADRQRIAVMAESDGQSLDRSGAATFRSLSPGIVTVEPDGTVRPVGDGMGLIVAEVDGAEVRANVRVIGTDRPSTPTFERDVMPLLSRLGCNAGACHGKQRGQNGFQLSILGYDPDFDHAAIALEGRGRRVFPASPEQSLLLRKATAKVAHGGGKRFEVGSESFEVIRRWIAGGMPRDPEGTPEVVALDVWPPDRSLKAEGRQQLLVTAHYSDGTTADVTHLAAYQSNESAVVAVDDRGLIAAGPLPGEAAISARFEGFFATCPVTIPFLDDVSADFYADLPRSNFIDDHVWSKLETLGLRPSGPASDATYLRRAFIDTIGRLPTPEEARAFLDDPMPEKRSVLVESLLERPEFAEHWASKWMDLLRPNPYRVGIKAVWNLDAWIRRSFRDEMPYDEFVRQIVTAEGSTFDETPSTIFRDRREPEELTSMVSQLFLGVRLECARCHHHPFEVWGQDDYYGFAAYFAEVGRKGTGLSPPISGSAEIVFEGGKGSVSHPLTGDRMDPAPLFGEAPDPEGDPREALADWITATENPYFSQVIVNRVWNDLMGVGLVMPVDDLRATNPPTNPELLKALADDFVANGHDLKHLVRTIMASRAYALDSNPNEGNAADLRNYSRHYRKRLRAEALLDAVCDATGVPEAYDGAPPGSRAVEIWTHRVPSTFLDTFGRPDPNQDPPCERTPETSVTQVLHLMNSPDLHRKVTDDDGHAARLAASDATPEAIVEDLYLRLYSREPTLEELRIALDVFEEPGIDRRRAAEDLLWALLNTAEFLFVN